MYRDIDIWHKDSSMVWREEKLENGLYRIEVGYRPKDSEKWNKDLTKEVLFSHLREEYGIEKDRFDEIYNCVISLIKYHVERLNNEKGLNIELDPDKLCVTVKKEGRKYGYSLLYSLIIMVKQFSYEEGFLRELEKKGECTIFVNDAVREEEKELGKCPFSYTESDSPDELKCAITRDSCRGAFCGADYTLYTPPCDGKFQAVLTGQIDPEICEDCLLRYPRSLEVGEEPVKCCHFKYIMDLSSF